MIPQDYLTFFSASLTADGALIGLLFVAIAIEPANIFGEVNQERELAANGAFTSLVNAFLISMLALIPRINIGIAVIVTAGISLLLTITHAIDKLRRGQRAYVRSMLYTGGGLVLYSLEIVFSIQLLQQPKDSVGALDGLITVLVAVYGVALARAWSLLGGESRTLSRMLVDAIRSRIRRSQATQPAKPAAKPVPAKSDTKAPPPAS